MRVIGRSISIKTPMATLEVASKQCELCAIIVRHFGKHLPVPDQEPSEDNIEALYDDRTQEELNFSLDFKVSHLAP